MQCIFAVQSDSLYFFDLRASNTLEHKIKIISLIWEFELPIQFQTVFFFSSKLRDKTVMYKIQYMKSQRIYKQVLLLEIQ